MNRRDAIKATAAAIATTLGLRLAKPTTPAPTALLRPVPPLPRPRWVAEWVDHNGVHHRREFAEGEQIVIDQYVVTGATGCPIRLLGEYA